MDEKENCKDTGTGTDREGVADSSRFSKPAPAGTTPPEHEPDARSGQADDNTDSRARDQAAGDSSVPLPHPSEPGQTREEPVSQPAPPPPEDVLIQRVLTDILRLIGFRVRVDLVRRPDGYHANIRSRQSTGILIGHRGNMLRALQYLVRTIVRQTYPDVPPVTVDVGGYRVRRENFLKKKATAVARIVLETGREMALDLLTEKEMELVRDALQDEPRVRVYALGTGTRRNVIIAPLPEHGD